MKLYFGPVTRLPSWYWVGLDIAKVLQSKHEIRFFSDINDIQSEAIVFWIKCPLNNHLATDIDLKRLRIIFFPVDSFLSRDQFVDCWKFIDACRLVVLHSQSMTEFFIPERVRFIDHYNKFGIDPRLRCPGSELLWIGGFQYFPYVYRYVLEKGLHKLKINYLTDFKNPNSISSASRLGKELGLGIDLSKVASLSKFRMFEWSEMLQKKLLINCRAAFDCKDDQDFNQLHKPPTKLQKYICSGIPCAINHSSPLRSSLGLELCDIMDTSTWFSPAYQKLSNSHGELLRTKLTIQVISEKYLEFAKELQNGISFTKQNK